MRDEVIASLKDAVLRRNVSEVLAIVTYQYEFECQSFVYAGPGHQSKHVCSRKTPHPIDGEHEDFNTEWKGTSVAEFEEVESSGGRKYQRIKKLVSNAPHRGNCGCSYS